jgi:hypothetical protein
MLVSAIQQCGKFGRRGVVEAVQREHGSTPVECGASSCGRARHGEVGEQPRAARHVDLVHRGTLGGEVLAQLGHLLARDGGGQALNHGGLEHLPHLKHLPCLLDARLGDSSVTSLSRLSRFSAWRTSVRETWKISAIFCSASLVPGIRRRSYGAAGAGRRCCGQHARACASSLKWRIKLYTTFNGRVQE